jgi:glutaredoxin
MPDFSRKISTQHEFDTLIKNENDLDVNKVILFTKKDKVPPTFKALSAEFRDRIRFNIIQINDKKGNEEMKAIQEKFGVTSLPSIIVEQSYNAQED